MQNDVTGIIPYQHSPFMEVRVSIQDESEDPLRQSIEVTLYMEKNPALTLDQIRLLAIQQAYDFLGLALSARQ